MAGVISNIRSGGMMTFIGYVNDKGVSYFINDVKQIPTSGLWNLTKGLKLSRQLATWGHRNFPNELGLDPLRHQLSAFLLASQVGSRRALSLTSGNEFLGLLMHDLPAGRFPNGMTAYEDRDFRNNATGIFYYNLWSEGFFE